jgi:hypothetical protein
MEFMDYDWDDIAASFVKEGILGADFTFTTKSELTHTVDYLPKNQARKLYTFAKEQLDLLKNPAATPPIVEEVKPVIETPVAEEVEEIATEEVTDFAEIIPATPSFNSYEEPATTTTGDRKLSELSQDELFEKLQNHKKLLDNGLILQGEYDTLKKEILSYM